MTREELQRLREWWSIDSSDRPGLIFPLLDEIDRLRAKLELRHELVGIAVRYCSLGFSDLVQRLAQDIASQMDPDK